MPNIKKSSKKQLNRETVANIINDCKVAASQLKKYSDTNTLPATTKQAPQLDLYFGQDRAVHALQTACAIRATGYHIFAAGENGLGKRTFIQHYLNQHGVRQAPVQQWVYLHNFQNPHQPIAIDFLDLFASNLVTSHQTATYASQLTQQIEQIWQNACRQFLPDSSDSDTLATTQSPLLPQVQSYLDSLFANAIDTLNLDTFNFDALNAAKLNTRTNTHTYNKASDNAHKLGQFLQSLQADMAHQISTRTSGQITQMPENYRIQPIVAIPHPTMKLSQQGAPIVFEPNPSLANLFGRIHYPFASHTYDGGSDNASTPYAMTSSMLPHHSPVTHSPVTQQPRCPQSMPQPLIEAGALHQANGGYLIIEAHQLKDYPEAWQALKLALRTKRIDFNFAQQQSTTTTQIYSPFVLPEPIPLSVKVILLGDPDLYDHLADQDIDFSSLFKIRADFHQEVERNVANEQQMIAKLADIIDKYQINHFDASAQAVVLEFLSLQCEDQNKLSLHADSLIQLMLEASRHAELTEDKLLTTEGSGEYSDNSQITAANNTVSAKHVKQALTDITYRSGYLKELYLQEITDGQQLISTSGSAIGQINALTIVDYANSEFGMPALLTAVVQNSVGSGDILDIERDVELGGSLHAKGMLIMNSYLRALFSPYYPLNFTASLAFEQSYAHIDGDSATLAEACALLSALAEVPISQGLGITGSMNQLGRVQAVGGVNTKIAGFFDACAHQGLTGDQGVILPFANISQLMLRDDIIAAVKAGQFHIYGVKTLSEALTILANTTVDSKNKKGRYRHSSLFGKIIKNLQKWEEQLNPPEEPDESSLAESICEQPSCDCAKNVDTAKK